jgi:hypothetical protein
MTGLLGLRRATAADIAAVTALQRAAYARNRVILGVEPLPLMADYAHVFAAFEVWLAEGPDGLQGILILERRTDDLLLWSVRPRRSCAAAGSAIGCWRRRRCALWSWA